MSRKLFSMALLAGMALLGASCSDDETTNNDGGIADGTTLSGTITEDVTLKSGNTYKLSGAYTVEEGATLNIEPGVKIVAVYDDNVDYILIKQGAKINAKGTASAPIIMTSEKEEAGAWGGIHICGRAHTNAEGGKGSSEIGGAEYGGNDDKDNSGVLQYVRLEYTGYAFDEEHEANGISFYGVGSGTTVDHCQAYQGSDDGFEFFGGSVNVSNMVVTSCSDDSFDWTEGWNGTATDLIAIQEAEETLGYACDCLIEADNNENNYSATPVAHPTLKNLILVGNGAAGKGVHLRRGTQVTIENAEIYGKQNAIYVESAETENALANGTSSMSNVSISGILTSKEGIYTNAEFEADGNKANQANPYTSYENIIAKCPWAAGWTKNWSESDNILANESTLQGTITNDITLGAGNTYYLSGAYTVEAGATLHIQAGVKIISKYDDNVDYILIKQGAKINATGTADAPIVMTAEKQSAGAWGGIHICGRAHTNAEGGKGSSEIGGAEYGGNDDKDNSGVLQYVRLEYTGYAFDEEHEANGISFYGVGSGTTVDHCQAYQGSDDGFEFFGGSVNVSNMVVTSCSDDSFDWTEGWNGTATDLIAIQEAEETLGYACDCLIEADNNENNYSATPVAHPTLKNLILVGNGAAGKGVHLRRGTQVTIENAEIYGKQNAIYVESAETENALVNGTSSMSNVSISGILTSKEGIYTNTEFEADGNKANQANPYTSYEDIIAKCPWAAGWTKNWSESDNVLANESTLQGTITNDITLGAGNTYYLSGAYTVEAGATLHIQAGVKIISKYDDNVDYILIKQGAKINATGTADAPIVMTAEKQSAGAWGGIHICGRAHTNAEGGKGSSEIGGAEYGGSDDKDNSGVLQYVRLEYTGYAFDEEHEANGISFYGVGSGTTVDHCVAYQGSDDGFEFFGGSVNVSNMVVISCSDDSFDWTEGWNGTATDIVAYQEAEATLGYDCDCLIEADNNENNYEATPVAHPTLKNLILVGNGGSKQGVRLRRGTQVTMDNAQICGKGKALTVESAETENALVNGTSSITNTTISNNVNSEKGIYTNDIFAAATGNKVDANLSYASLEDIKKACDWMNGKWVD